MAGKLCSICGKPSGLYPLCSDCFKLRDAGKVVKCDTCKTWHLVDVPCKCDSEIKPTVAESQSQGTEGEEANTINQEKSCSVCGKPSGKYPICKACFKLKEAGKVVKCESCKNWHYADECCACAKDNVSQPSAPDVPLQKQSKLLDSSPSSSCIVCGADSSGHIQCNSCYEASIAFRDEQSKEKPHFEHKDYYFNLKSNIYRIYQFERVKENSNKLMGLAMILEKYYDDKSLISRVENDIHDIIIAKTPREEQKITPYTEKQDKKREEVIRTLDGHWVRSNAEEIIDNILYTSGLVHSYGKQVSEIPISERTVNCDWYIPVTISDGIYIEYWGMEGSSKYEKNKAVKLELYKKYKIHLIQIEKDEVRGDSQGLKDRLLREIRELKAQIHSLN